MKILMLFVHDYWLKPYEKNLPEAPDAPDEIATGASVVALLHVESGDEERRAKLVTKAIKQIKWLAKKLETRSVVLHSFAHLATTNADPVVAEEMILAMRDRLTDSGWNVVVSPFGYFNEFRLHVAGPSLAKVFVDL